MVRSCLFRIEFRTKSRLAELIIAFALFRISKDLIGDGYFLESFFGRLVAWIDVRMILARELPVRFADFVGAGRRLNAQDPIIVLFLHPREFETPKRTCQPAPAT